MRILITGGGSGGHVSPALAVARQLQQRYPEIDLLYVGGKLTMEGSSGSSIEEQLVRAAGLPFVAIHAGKLRRQALGLATLKRLWGVIPGCAEALAVVRKFRPEVVFSTGGYASVPVVLAAGLLRIPVVVHEQTAAVGLANRLAARVATKVAVTFPSSQAFFPLTKTVVTGNPIRPEILQPDIEQLKQTSFGQWLFSSVVPLVYITGGGLGSHVLNETVAALLPALLKEFRVVHQCGAHEQFADYEKAVAAAAGWPEKLRRHYWPVRSLTAEEVGGVYQVAALVVARAGANTVLELAAVGLPTIFVPIPWVTHDEQTRNAQLLVEAGTAEILPEAVLSPSSLASHLQEMADQLETYREHKERALQLVDFQAVEKLTDLVVNSRKLQE